MASPPTPGNGGFYGRKSLFFQGFLWFLSVSHLGGTPGVRFFWQEGISGSIRMQQVFLVDIIKSCYTAGEADKQSPSPGHGAREGPSTIRTYQITSYSTGAYATSKLMGSWNWQVNTLVL
jgi:hypothetical protein